ncbi:ATP-binding cassette domain-containing protein [Oricola sp.]|uniref:thiamine ABC transporter ATP-binding protein n=1 Tax=Oricola sp. TaxID=1979950 RepID=UPI003BA91A58
MIERPAGVQCRALEFSYAQASETMRLDGSFAAGEVTAVLGPSGSGKSTLLNLIAGFASPLAGQVLFGGIDMTGAPVGDRPVSMVFQENNLFAHLSVYQNVALGVSPNLALGQADRARVEEALTSVGLAGYGSRRPAQLSGGERQRVALARVVVRQRPVLLLDEAFSSLGPALRGDMLDLLRKIQRERGMTAIMVTHFPDDALRAASRVMFIESGTIIAAGPTAEILDAETAPSRVRDYLGANRSDRFEN